MPRALSIYLDVLRIVLAFTVLVGHTSSRWFTAGALPDLGTYGHQAVIGFFVLSGFVVAQAAERQSGRDYFIARAARLYSVVLPVMLLAALLSVVGRYFDAEIYGTLRFDQPLLQMAAGLTFTQWLWFFNIVPFANVPLWSLTYEATYYAMFGAALFLPRGKATVAVLALALVAGPCVALLLPLFLSGVVAWRVHRRFPRGLGVALSILTLLAYALLIAPRPFLPWQDLLSLDDLAPTKLLPLLRDQYMLGALVALHLAGIAVLTRDTPTSARRGIIGRIAGMTFTLYALHMPLLYAISAITPAEVDSIYVVGLLAAVIVICGVVAQFTEQRKNAYRAMIARMFDAISVRRSRSPSRSPRA